MKILVDVDDTVETNDIEACHRFGKSNRKTTRKKTICLPTRK